MCYEESRHRDPWLTLRKTTRPESELHCTRYGEGRLTAAPHVGLPHRLVHLARVALFLYEPQDLVLGLHGPIIENAGGVEKEGLDVSQECLYVRRTAP